MGLFPRTVSGWDTKVRSDRVGEKGRGFEEAEQTWIGGETMTVGELISAFFTTAGPGGVFVILVILLAATIYFLLTRWILQGAEVDEERAYRAARRTPRIGRRLKRKEERR